MRLRVLSSPLTLPLTLPLKTAFEALYLIKTRFFTDTIILLKINQFLFLNIYYWNKI